MRRIPVKPPEASANYRAELTISDVIVLKSMGEEVAIEAKEAPRS